HKILADTAEDDVINSASHIAQVISKEGDQISSTNSTESKLTSLVVASTWMLIFVGSLPQSVEPKLASPLHYLDCAQMDYQSLQYTPSHLAAAALTLAFDLKDEECETAT